MARLADLISQWKWTPPVTYSGATDDVLAEWKTAADDLRDKIAASVIISADNVCEYLFAGTDQEEWEYMKDFPCCAPPFPSFFIEMARPSRITSEKPRPGSSASMLPLQWGWYFEAIDHAEIIAGQTETPGEAVSRLEKIAAQVERVIDVRLIQAAAQSTNHGVDPAAAFAGLPDREKDYVMLLRTIEAAKEGNANFAQGVAQELAATSWILKAVLVASSPGKIVGPSLALSFQIGEAGNILHKPMLQVYGNHAFNNRSLAEGLSQTSGPLIFPALLALSFVNCKNVQVVNHEPAPPSSGTHLKRPLLRYHVLNIEPMKTVLRRDGGSETAGVKRALHICRGHFANYTERGLFGKYFGRFWVPSHVRGSTSQGYMEKDYAVQPGKHS